jgi:competence protein ComEA
VRTAVFDLTPSERRGALVVAALLVLGAAWDLGHRVPAPAPPAPASPSLGSAAPAGRDVPPAPEPVPLDLNSADSRQLDALPGIGPVLAARIVAHRARIGRFRTVEELLAVRGIGPTLFARLAPRLRVSGGDSTRARIVQSATPRSR